MEVGEPVFLNNGAQANTLPYIGNILNNGNSETNAWDSDRLGALPPYDAGNTLVSQSNYGNNVIEGPIALFTPDLAPGEDCLDGAKFNQSKPIAGFVWGAIYDVQKQGNQKFIRAKLDLDDTYDYGSGSGGAEGSNVVAPDSGALIYRCAEPVPDGATTPSSSL